MKLHKFVLQVGARHQKDGSSLRLIFGFLLQVVIVAWSVGYSDENKGTETILRKAAFLALLSLGKNLDLCGYFSVPCQVFRSTWDFIWKIEFVEKDETHPLNESQVEFLVVIFLCINICNQCQGYTVGSGIILKFLTKELLMTSVTSKRVPMQPGSTSVCFTVWLALGHPAFFSCYFNYTLVLWKVCPLLAPR